MAMNAAASIRSIMDCPCEIEFIFRIDSDDNVSCEHASQLAHLGIVIVGRRMRGYEDMNVFYTEAARISTGTWLWLVNDDIECFGRGLDSIVKRHIPSSKPCIVKVDDGFTGHGRQAIFPIIPRIFIDALGRISPHYSSDSYLFMLSCDFGFPTYLISEIKITHHRDPIDPHQIDKLGREHAGDWKSDWMKALLARDAEKLRRYMEFVKT